LGTGFRMYGSFSLACSVCGAQAGKNFKSATATRGRIFSRNDAERFRDVALPSPDDASPSPECVPRTQGSKIISFPEHRPPLTAHSVCVTQESTHGADVKRRVVSARDPEEAVVEGRHEELLHHQSLPSKPQLDSGIASLAA
jgi:hypothetical protein